MPVPAVVVAAAEVPKRSRKFGKIVVFSLRSVCRELELGHLWVLKYVALYPVKPVQRKNIQKLISKYKM